MLDDEILQLALKELEKPETLKMLYSYALHLCRGVLNTADFSHEDLVHEAIMLLLTGKRKWDPRKVPDIKVLIMGIIKSLFSHNLDKLKKYKKIEVESGDSFKAQARKVMSQPPEDSDREVIFSELIQEIENAVGDDDELMGVYLAYLDGCRTPTEIAEAMGISKKSANATIRRFQRTCQKQIRFEDWR